MGLELTTDMCPPITSQTPQSKHRHTIGIYVNKEGHQRYNQTGELAGMPMLIIALVKTRNEHYELK